MTKEEIRRTLRKERSCYTEGAKSSRLMGRWLMESNLYREAQTLLAFIPFRQEPDLLGVLAQAAGEGKTVALPQVTGPGEMVFRRGDHPERWVKNSWGIPEPDGREEEIRPGAHTLILVPGLAYDRRGYRIGYGGGFYDRYLRSCPTAVTLGTAFSFQILQEIPAEPQDMPVQYILSEKGIISVESGIDAEG